MFSGAIPQKTLAPAEQSFRALGLSEPVVERLAASGFRHPTPIQAEVIPRALAGRDVIGLAQTGSGKTAAFCLPMVERLAGGGPVRGLVLCPTREIALQNEAFLDWFREVASLASACVIGGVRIGPQVEALARGPEVVVATPGRLLDHLERGNLALDRVATMVLDEADHMLDLGFMPQVHRILEALPRERQTMMFSATMPEAIGRLAQRFMREPAVIDLSPAGRAAEGIEHRLYLVAAEDKKPSLLALAARERGSMLIFVRRRVDADWACRQLEIEGHPVDRIHSDRTQAERVAALRGMRQGEHRILVATDIAARGIDIPLIEHIVNFNVPQTVEDYIHRAGRTARGAAGGTVSTIATWLDLPMVREIEGALGAEIPRCTAPGIEPYLERRRTIRGRERVRRRLL